MNAELGMHEELGSSFLGVRGIDNKVKDEKC
jgi:hypothetical protein